MIVQRSIESAGIPTVLIAALPPIAKQQGSPRVVAPMVPMGANAGEPKNKGMQTVILRDALQALVQMDSFGQILNLPYEYRAKI